MIALPVLYVVACGARPAADVPEFVTWSMGQGWDTCVIVTPSALRFADVNRLADLTGHPVRSDYKRPEDPDALPPADAFAVAPCTFNTVNKWAAGISDTLALGLLNEALCGGAPITAIPNPNVTLARHPAFTRNVAFLRECGVHVLFDPDRYPLPTPNLGEASRDLFPWEALKAAVTEMRAQVRIPDAAHVDDHFALCDSRSLARATRARRNGARGPFHLGRRPVRRICSPRLDHRISAGGGGPGGRSARRRRRPARRQHRDACACSIAALGGRQLWQSRRVRVGRGSLHGAGRRLRGRCHD